jgi:hypothetical protein
LIPTSISDVAVAVSDFDSPLLSLFASPFDDEEPEPLA